MQAYDVEVRDHQQPMLVSRPKKKDQREGAPEMLYLLPELCTRTGLTPAMRENFSVMKDLAVHTRVDPDKRAKTMNDFRQQIQTSAKAQKQLDGWGIKFSSGLVEVRGRQVPSEKIILGPDRGTNRAKIVGYRNPQI